MTLLRSPLSFLTVLAVGFALVGSAGGQGTSQPTLTVLSRDGRRGLPLTLLNGQEFVFLDDLASAFQVAVREESLGTVTVAYKGKTILLTPDQPLVSIAGRLVSLPAALTRSERRWVVPVEFINRALGLVYDSRLDLRKSSRLLVVGDLRVPKLTVRVEPGDPARVVVDAVPRSASTLSHENNSLVVRFDADAVDVAVPAIQPQALVRAVRLVEPAALAIDLGPRFMGFRATTEPLDSTSRLTIDVMSTQPEAQPPQPAQPPLTSTPDLPDISALGPSVTSVRAIAIDPGHGGDDDGVKGVGGAKEKDLTLAVARRVKAIVESRLGIRVLLTRDDDRNVPLDSRTAMANNSKADLLISLHANASLLKTATGASVLYASFDREDTRAAQATLSSLRLPTFGGGQRDIDLVLWDLAQIRHLDRSKELAGLVQMELRGRVPLSTDPIGRAPLNVLESANMPAVLIEMGYLTNPGQEAAMAGGGFQNTFGQAVYDAVVKFRENVSGAR